MTVPTTNSQGLIRRIIEKDGRVLVSFDTHDAYFEASADVVPALRMAAAEKDVVHFAYDVNMTIRGVITHPSLDALDPDDIS